MKHFTEFLDTFFNGRPAPRTETIEALRKENQQLRDIVKRIHLRNHDCHCWVCAPK